MAFEMDFEDIDPNEVGGKEFIQPGMYHMLVESVDEEGGKNGAMRVEFQVLRGTVSGEETKIFTLDFQRELKPFWKKRFWAFAVAARLKTQKELEDCQARRERPVIEWTEAVGRSVCMKLTEGEGQYAGYVNLNFDSIWRPDDKRASQIPLHAETLKREGIKMPSNRNPDGSLIKSDAADKGGKSATKSSASAKKAEAAPVDLLDGVI